MMALRYQSVIVVVVVAAASLLSSFYGAEAATILGVFPVGGTSHWSPYEAMLKALSAAGHDIIVITAYPQKSAIPRWRDIHVKASKPAMNSLDMKLVETVLQKTTANMNYIIQLSRTYCRMLIDVPEVKQLLSGQMGKIDVVITEIFGSDCSVGFAWKLGASLISTSSSSAQPWAHARVGNVIDTSCVPTIHVNYPLRMNFHQRFVNTLWHIYYVTMYEYWSNAGETEEISKQLFGPDVPSVREIVRNTSLLFVNSHHSLDGSNPLVPNIIEISGIHLNHQSTPPNLPTDIKDFIEGAEEGVIYFTLGSLVRVSTLPNETIRSFRDAFAELPQRVLWKFELPLKDRPPNVMTSSWFPQKDIFKHPKVKLFVTHGGRMGITEAVHYGIPLVAIPLFFDQYRNAQKVVDKGVAVSLNFRQLTKDNILTALKEVLGNPRYAARMKELCTLFKDRPMTPAQSVVYWTEYVIRHKGAFHLRSPAADMPWYQYYLIDVIGTLIFCLFSILYVLRRLFSFLTSLLPYNKKIKTT